MKDKSKRTSNCYLLRDQCTINLLITDFLFIFISNHSRVPNLLTDVISGMLSGHFRFSCTCLCGTVKSIHFMRMRGHQRVSIWSFLTLWYLTTHQTILFLVADGSYFTYFQVIIMLSLIEPVVFILTVIIWGCDENKIFRFTVLLSQYDRLG